MSKGDMRLRVILLVLSLLAVFSAAAGGYFYYSAVNAAALKETDGRLISVSDYWAEVLGYDRTEVTGKKLTNFMTADSRRYAEEKVFPEFFKTGSCKEVSYRFVRKNGQQIDILLSAIADRNAEGLMTRTLAVPIDVTERKKAEEALEKAKEELSLYSRDLERQVQLRTKEISGILKYTPAVLYFKDSQRASR